MEIIIAAGIWAIAGLLAQQAADKHYRAVRGRFWQLWDAARKQEVRR